MKHLICLKRILRDEAGVTVIEYGLIISLIVLAIMTSLRGVADETNGLWAVVSRNVTGAMSNE